VQNRGLERQVLNELRELDTQTVSVDPTVVSSRLGPFARHPGTERRDRTELTETALEPIAKGVGINYSLSGYRRPRTDPELGFEALRGCSSLLLAFAYADAWPGAGRAARKRARRAADVVRVALRTDEGRDAIAWATRRYGEHMAALHRDGALSHPDEADAYHGAADSDEWPAGLAARVWPVSASRHEDMVAYTGRLTEIRDPNATNAPITLRSYADRTAATVEMLSIAAACDRAVMEPAFLHWTIAPDLHMNTTVMQDWIWARHHWANLVGPEPQPYLAVMRAVAKRRE
jgi:hypothetical protein